MKIVRGAHTGVFLKLHTELRVGRKSYHHGGIGNGAALCL